MSSSRRLAKIEEIECKESTSVIKLKEKILFIQKKLLSEICLPAANPTQERNLVEVLDKWITTKIFRESEITFESVASVNFVFKELLSSFNKECEKLGITATHTSLCDAMRLLLGWYHILSLDVVLQAPLVSELAIKDSERLNKQAEIAKKRALLIKQVQHFNFKITDTEERYSHNKIISLDFNDEDLCNVYFPLLREEKTLLSSSFAGYDGLKKECQALEKEIGMLEQEAEDVVHEYKRACQARKEKRCQLSDSKLNDIDVYYVKEFKDRYPLTVHNYNKKFVLHQQEDKIHALESLITSMTTPFKEFSADLGKFYYQTYTYPWSLYQTAINGIYSLLNEEHSAFKSNSVIFALDQEYEQQYKYVHETMPLIQQTVENDYAKSANEFLQEVARRSWRQVMAIREEATHNFDNDINDYIKKLIPKTDGLTIKPIQLQDIYKKYLNESWRDSFVKFFSKKINSIQAEFERLQGDKSIYALEQVKQLCNDFPEAKAMLFEKVVTQDKLQNRFGVISELLVDTYNCLQRNPVFAKMEQYIVERTRGKQFEQKGQRQGDSKKILERKKEIDFATEQKKLKELQQDLQRINQQSEQQTNNSNRNSGDVEIKRIPNPDAEHAHGNLLPYPYTGHASALYPDIGHGSGNALYPDIGHGSGNALYPDIEHARGNSLYPDIGHASDNALYPGIGLVSGNALPYPDTGYSRPDLAEVTFFPWKRVLFWGLATLTLMAAAFTIIGLVAEISLILAMSITGGGLLFGCSGYGITHYLVRKDSSFTRKDSSFTRKDSSFSKKDLSLSKKDLSLSKKDTPHDGGSLLPVLGVHSGPRNLSTISAANRPEPINIVVSSISPANRVEQVTKTESSDPVVSRSLNNGLFGFFSRRPGNEMLPERMEKRTLTL